MHSVWRTRFAERINPFPTALHSSHRALDRSCDKAPYCWRKPICIFHYSTAFSFLKVPGLDILLYNDKKWEKLLTNEESGGMMSKLRLGNRSGQKITSKKVEKSPWHLRTTVIEYQSCFWYRKSWEKTNLKKLKSSWQTENNMIKYQSCLRQHKVSEAHESAIHSLATASLIKRDS